MNLGLDGKVAVIIGGTSGIGLETARQFQNEGASVAICGRDAERARKAASVLDSDRCLTAACDATNEQDVASFINSAATQFGGIDILVNSAGRSQLGRFFDVSDAQWDEQIRLKFFAVIYAVRAVTPHMRQRGGGRIINLNSTSGMRPEPHMIATGATRAGLLNLSRSLALELAPDRILVNSVCVGIIRTDLWERRRLAEAPDADEDAWYRQLAERRGVPLGRVGTAEEVAAAIVFLASDRSSYTSGATLEVTGLL